jgi:hypothetical protein
MSQASLSQSQPARNGASGTRTFLLVVSGFVLALALVGAVNASRAVVSFAPTASRSFTNTLDGATSANVRVEFGAGNLSIGALTGNADTLGTMAFDGPSDQRPDASYRVRNGVGELAYGIGNDGPRLNIPFFGRSRDHMDMRVQLAAGVPMALDVQAGAADSTIDLTALRVTQLRLETGAADTVVRLPANAGLTTVRATGGISDLTFEVPSGVAVDMRLSGGMTAREIDQTRFRSLGNGHYRSPDFDSAANRAVLDVDLGIATITVR